MQIRITSSEPLAGNSLGQVLLTPHSSGTVDVTASFVYQGQNVWLGSYRRNMGFGDIDLIQVSALDSCGNLGLSSGSFSKEIRSSRKKIVILNSIFRPELGERTTCHVQPESETRVKVSVYDLRGERVRILADKLVAGSLDAVWDGLDSRGLSLPAGYYIISVEMDGRTETRKIALK